MLAMLLKSLVALVLAMSAQAALAQNQPNSPANPPPASAPTQQLLRPEELDQLVSPVALYPDTLLANVLMASTYPLEVVEASRWAEANKNLNGDELKVAVDKQSWDTSVKQLTATPSVLANMSNNISWMQKLGDAVLAQQADVMDSVQRLRTKAQANHKLETTKQQTVTVRTEQNRQIIAIEPTDPNTIYVPYYEPAVAFGAWDYPDYPPYDFPMLSDYYYGYYGGGAILATGLAFGAGYALGAWAGNNGYWGGGINWSRNDININRPINGNRVTHWTHNPAHRQGVRYGNNNVANKFNRAGNVQNRGQQARQNAREGNRGNRGQQKAGSGNQRQHAANRGGSSQRKNAANRGGQQKKAANRGSSQRKNAASRGGQRQNVANRHGNRQRTASRGGGRQFGNVGAGARAARAQGMGGRGMGGFRGGGARAGGGFRGGGGGRGGGRRSDIVLKHDITLLGHLDNGLGFYRFSYDGSSKAYVGVIAQEVQTIAPEAVYRGQDGYLRVRYEKLGVKFQTFDEWLRAGARIPITLH